MFIAFGALGGQLIGSVTQRVFGNVADLWKSMVLTASILLPLAALTISRRIKPYGREVERLARRQGGRRGRGRRPPPAPPVHEARPRRHHSATAPRGPPGQ